MTKKISAVRDGDKAEGSRRGVRHLARRHLQHDHRQGRADQEGLGGERRRGEAEEQHRDRACQIED